MATSIPFANSKIHKKRRVIAAITVIAVMGGFYVVREISVDSKPVSLKNSITEVRGEHSLVYAREALEQLPIKGRAPKNTYQRSNFGNGWISVAGCDLRNRILARDLTEVRYRSGGCVVESGLLIDPYTATEIMFKRGDKTSSLVQIDHVVALSDAWQKGAQNMSQDERIAFANDQLNLLAVDGDSNEEKSDSDAASWLPPNKSYRCRYVARQIAVKQKYRLWVTGAEHDAMSRVLEDCPTQALPLTQ